MYEAYFEFAGRPFAAVPMAKEYFPASAIEIARQTLLRCLQRGEGIGLVVGPSGTGKTLLCDILTEQLQSSFSVVKLSCGRLSTRSELFQTILYELGRPYRQMDEGELRLALVDFLTVAEERPSGLVLLADEAHYLPLRLLEEIRMLTNLALEGEPLVRLVAIGASSLEERLAHPKLESLNQRIVARCYLDSFTRSETEEYICAQIAAVGGWDGIFPTEAKLAVHHATGGVPRLINQLCDHAFLMLYANGGESVTAAGVEEAWADLQQLPTPWNGNDLERGEAGVVEFGGLDDEVHDGEAASSLRVAAVVNDEVFDPGHDIENIQGDLERLEEEFVPVGSICPEATLTFGTDPFAEAFEEEEVVVDRYSLPEGKSRRGRSVCKEVQNRDFATEHCPEEVGSESMPREQTVREEPVSEDGTETSSVLIHGGPRSSDDMILIEDGCDAFELERPQNVLKVRKQEYRNLFAKLRHG